MPAAVERQPPISFEQLDGQNLHEHPHIAVTPLCEQALDHFHFLLTLGTAMPAAQRRES